MFTNSIAENSYVDRVVLAPAEAVPAVALPADLRGEPVGAARVHVRRDRDARRLRRVRRGRGRAPAQHVARARLHRGRQVGRARVWGAHPKGLPVQRGSKGQGSRDLGGYRAELRLNPGKNGD